MMRETKEIRWFFQYKIKPIQKWFDGLGSATSETRTDYYLKSKNLNIGVKLRDNKVEIKQRVGTRAKGCLNPNLWGHYDNFVKWSFDAEGKDPLFSEVLDGKFDNWIPIKKERTLVQLTEKQGKITFKPVSAHVPFGCQVEYSKIQIDKNIWHTFGLEWFGEPCLELDDSLISNIFADTKLSINQSLGYSDFIDKFQNSFWKKQLYPCDFSTN